MIDKFFAKLMGGTSNEKELKRLWPMVHEINDIAESFKNLTDEELKAKTIEFKYRFSKGETVNDLLPDAYAAVKETCRRLVGKKWTVRGHEMEWNMVPYDVQILGGIALHEGKIAEMATGEGKTLVATMPLYLNALTGKGVHLITVNDYLAQRDCEWMGKIYEFLGLTVAAIFGDQSPEERKAAYEADISYGTNNEFGFDYLRDNMATNIWNVVQRELNYAIVDEVDSVLIDEARTPLIISGAVGAPRNVYHELKPVVANLYKKQKELVTQLIRDGRELLEKDEEQAGLTLLRALRGNPKDQEILDLLTSEFWIKKLIERIQGQYEVNKTMSEVDSELYYTIDEKSHVVDITEKGRIFLSGGRDLDIVFKIQMLDQLDERLAQLGEQKNNKRFFSHDALTGLCNGLAPEGQLALCGSNYELSDAAWKAVEALSAQMAKLPEEVNTYSKEKKADKTTTWRRYYAISKKVDRLIDGLTDDSRQFLSRDQQGKPYVQALDKLFEFLRQQADVEANPEPSRFQIDRRLELQSTLLETDKTCGCPIGLTPHGFIAILVMLGSGDPSLLPFIAKIQRMLDGQAVVSANDNTGLDRYQDYFEFSDNGLIVRHMTEKGRIAILGGNPDLYILPDRGIVEDKDRQIQLLLDKTLNQSQYDYTARIVAIESIEQDLEGMYKTVVKSHAGASLQNDFYQIHSDNPSGAGRIHVTDRGVAFLSNFAHQTSEIISQLDADIRAHRDQLNKIFAMDEKNRITGLTGEELDRLAKGDFADIQSKIGQWQKNQSQQDNDNPIRLRISLDEFLGNSSDPASSLSRRFEEVTRIYYLFQELFQHLNEEELSLSDKRRQLKRYFDLADQKETDASQAHFYGVIGLSELGVKNFLGTTVERSQTCDRFLQILKDPMTDPSLVFELSEDGIPTGMKKSFRTQLLDGLPYFSYTEELHQFRDEILFFSNKKVSSRPELEGLLPKEKAHLRAKHIMLDEREMNELLTKVHAHNYVLSPEEIGEWFRLHFERKPRRLLDNQRDHVWQEYGQVEERIQNISQLLRAYTLYQKDVDYVVKTIEEDEIRRSGSRKGHQAVMIVDQFTGRLMPGRRFSDGLHEALEAKEGVEVQAESQTLATITLQNFFRLYKKLAGMTGTAETESQEFFSTYKMEVIVIPTNRPVIRNDHNDVIFRTKREKYKAIIDEAIAMHEAGRPVLLGSISVDVSQKLSEMFSARGIPIANWLKKGDVSKELESGKFHTVLNAKYHKLEAEIIAKAGLPGTITIATNMAGRGTDIKLSPGVVDKGGLHILGSEKHEARRIDRQLRGRSGRQGDPGSSRFYLSLEDDLMRLFGSDRITSIMSRMGNMEEGERIEHPLITRSIERAQKKVEERNFEIRKNLLDYDDVLNQQRKIIYKRRQNLLGFAEPADLIESKNKRYLGEERDQWKVDELIENFNNFFGIKPDFDADDLMRMKDDEIKDSLIQWVQERMADEQHLNQLQERHRMMGYCSVDLVISELIRIKLRLHSAGTSDTSKWNVEGIQSELERLFGTVPDWLVSGKLEQAQQVETKTIAWALDCYHHLTAQSRPGYQAITFAGIPLDEFCRIYVYGLMNQHLSSNVPVINWSTDDFLNDIERVFLSRLSLGANELRSIRREKIFQIVVDWIRDLHIDPKQDGNIRHRIFGYFSSVRFAHAVIQYTLREDDGSHAPADTISGEQETFLSRIFGEEPESVEPATAEAGTLTSRWLLRGRRQYMAVIKEHQEAYDQVMLNNATMEELIEACIAALLQEHGRVTADPEQVQKQLAQFLDFIFLSKPAKTMPAQADEAAMRVYKEDLAAWGLGVYKIYTDRYERLRQELLSGEIVRDSVFMMIEDTLYAMISEVLGGAEVLDSAQQRRIESECRLVFRQAPKLRDESEEPMSPTWVMDQVTAWAQKLYQQRIHEIGEHQVIRFERYHILDKIDENWRSHLNGVDELREGIGLRGYGQKDPLLEYKSEAYNMFVKMIDSINRDVVSTLFKFFDVGGEVEDRQMQRRQPSSFSAVHSQVEVYKQSMAAPPRKQEAQQPAPGQTAVRRPVVKAQQVGRNEPCPCGSGKKYKHCCGKSA
jgi:preprotein translocase subunit SecA